MTDSKTKLDNFNDCDPQKIYYNPVAGLFTIKMVDKEMYISYLTGEEDQPLKLNRSFFLRKCSIREATDEDIVQELLTILHIEMEHKSENACFRIDDESELLIIMDKYNDQSLFLYKKDLKVLKRILKKINL